MERIALRVGEVAARAGVHRETLRYYERRGLIPPPPRRISGYRAYPPETVERVRLIKMGAGPGVRPARDR
jgi:DNA-binding transcriptional MerR regulator